MVSEFIDLMAPRWNGKGERPRGLLPVPPEVEATIAKQEARLAREKNIVMTPEARQRAINAWTLEYYYEGQYVAHRSTANGVEVLAVGLEEIGPFLRAKSQVELLTIMTELV